eukprot:12894429-Alexandrium_andersonii.AAC.1
MRRQHSLAASPKLGRTHAKVVRPSCQRSKARTGSWTERLCRLFLRCLPAVAGARAPLRARKRGAEQISEELLCMSGIRLIPEASRSPPNITVQQLHLAQTLRT